MKHFLIVLDFESRNSIKLQNIEIRHHQCQPLVCWTKLHSTDLPEMHFCCLSFSIKIKERMSHKINCYSLFLLNECCCCRCCCCSCYLCGVNQRTKSFLFNLNSREFIVIVGCWWFCYLFKVVSCWAVGLWLHWLHCHCQQ